MSAPSFRSELHAERFTVKRILDLARAGELRLPIFQRPLRWRRPDHALLLDSLYQGFPVGTLLLWERSAPAGTVTFGPVQFSAADKERAYWIVDGQQRITSIVGCMAPTASVEEATRTHGVPDAHHVREFDFCFDLHENVFVRPPRIPRPHLVPVSCLRDAVATSMWASEMGVDAELHRRAQIVGERLRTYEMPAYILRAESDEVLRVVFDRTNSSGKRMQASEIFEALNRGFAPEDRPESLLERLQGVLHALEFGAIAPRTLQKTLVCVAGHNPRDDLPEALRAPGAARKWEARTAEALGRVVSFLRDEARIPHARALPYDLPVIALARLFDRFPAPSERNVELLVRWVWRGIHTHTHMVTNQQLNPLFSILKRETEDDVVQGMLRMVGGPPPGGLAPSERFNLRGMRTRTDLAVLFAQGPLELANGEPLGPTEVFEHDSGTIGPTLPGLGPEVGRGIGARLLHPPTPDLAALLRRAPEATLSSHAIPPTAWEAVRRGDWHAVATARQLHLAGLVDEAIARRARWSEDDDGPPIAALLDDDAFGATK